MEKIYKLFEYSYTYYNQGTEETDIGYALLHVPNDASFNNNRSTLLNNKHVEGSHEIDFESVKDLTIEF